MNPKTWPKQAELAQIANASGKKEDWDVFKAYVAYLKGGLPPEEKIDGSLKRKQSKR